MIYLPNELILKIIKNLEDEKRIDVLVNLKCSCRRFYYLLNNVNITFYYFWFKISKIITDEIKNNISLLLKHNMIYFKNENDKLLFSTYEDLQKDYTNYLYQYYIKYYDICKNFIKNLYFNQYNINILSICRNTYNNKSHEQEFKIKNKNIFKSLILKSKFYFKFFDIIKCLYWDDNINNKFLDGLLDILFLKFNIDFIPMCYNNISYKKIFLVSNEPLPDGLSYIKFYELFYEPLYQKIFTYIDKILKKIDYIDEYFNKFNSYTNLSSEMDARLIRWFSTKLSTEFKN